jgi:predicted small metal-binding protein
MYTIACQDMGVKDCKFVAKGTTPEEAMKDLSDHGMKTHAEMMKEMSKTMSQADMMAMMKKALKSS